MNDRNPPQIAGLARLMGEMFSLPLRMFGFAFAVARRSVQLPDLTEGSASASPAPPAPAPTLPASTVPPSGIAPPPPWASSVSTARPGGSATTATNPVATTVGESSGGGTVPKKENTMSSCQCDSDLSGCDLKVVQYTIVTVDPDPDIDDDRRVLAGPNVISTSDDLTDADFAAWVIARYLEGRHHDHGRHEPGEYNAQYLRVCYNVMCRLEMPCINYQSQQAHQLSRIARALEGKDHHDHGHAGHLVEAKEESKGTKGSNK